MNKEPYVMKELTGQIFAMAADVACWPEKDRARVHDLHTATMESAERMPWVRRAVLDHDWDMTQLFGMSTDKDGPFGLIVEIGFSRVRKWTPPPIIRGSRAEIATASGERLTVDYGEKDWSDAVPWWRHPTLTPENYECTMCGGNHTFTQCTDEKEN